MPIGGLGMGEIIVIFLVVLLLFGAKRLPEIGSALGKGIREFKSSVREIEGELKAPVDDRKAVRPRRRMRGAGTRRPPGASPPATRKGRTDAVFPEPGEGIARKVRKRKGPGSRLPGPSCGWDPRY